MEEYVKNFKLTGKMYAEELEKCIENKTAIKCNNGIFVGKENEDVVSFKGVPYAAPPVGELRWKNPKETEDSEDIFEAFYFGKSPIQTEWPSETGSYYEKGEDCLYLNVWVNKKNIFDNKTVMVFFHGGAFGWGGTSDPLYDGTNLVKKYDDIILVTVGYRVGLMGFVDFTGIDGCEDFKTGGNLGVLDQICALKWIQRNIAAFGGNPKNVTIFGESAGGGSVSLLPIMEEAKGLFKRVIAESGSVALSFSKEQCERLNKMLVRKTKCKSMDDLMALSEDELIKINEDLNDYNNYPERDGIVIPEDLYGAYENGATKGIDLLIGTNADELRYWIREMGYDKKVVSGLEVYKATMHIGIENDVRKLSEDEAALLNMFFEKQKEKNPKKIWAITEFYNEMLFRLPAIKQAESHAHNNGNAYMYYWTQQGEDKVLGACHAMELSYVFGNLDEKIYTGNLVNKELAEVVHEMWVNFARTGNPSTTHYEWKKYDAENRHTMLLGKKIGLTKDPKSEQRKLLMPLLKYYLNGCTYGITYNVPYTRKLVIKVLGGAAVLAGGVVGSVVGIKRALKR
ncbi:MAG: carboxylesterase family protein [Lachnospiraceae bacterium]|nr:carboxylesterase family protein [Lachnospiraceae bacterium]